MLDKNLVFRLDYSRTRVRTGGWRFIFVQLSSTLYRHSVNMHLLDNTFNTWYCDNWYCGLGQGLQVLYTLSSSTHIRHIHSALGSKDKM